MPECLLFELYAPLVSWGDIAVGERRPAQPLPTKSAVLGLVAGALGYSRNDDERHADLHRRFEVGARIELSGMLLVDYHTAQTAKASAIRRTRKERPIITRADLLRSVPELHTILSTRDYFSDGLAVVALLDRGGDLPLQNIAEALERPHYAPYLGRRCCSPALPFAPQIVDAESPLVALRAMRTSEAYDDIARHLRRKNGTARRVFVWEGDGSGSTSSVVRRDALLSRSRWQFSERIVHRTEEEVADAAVADRV